MYFSLWKTVDFVLEILILCIWDRVYSGQEYDYNFEKLLKLLTLSY